MRAKTQYHDRINLNVTLLILILSRHSFLRLGFYYYYYFFLCVLFFTCSEFNCALVYADTKPLICYVISLFCFVAICWPVLCISWVILPFNLCIAFVVELYTYANMLTHVRTCTHTLLHSVVKYHDCTDVDSYTCCCCCYGHRFHFSRFTIV